MEDERGKLKRLIGDMYRPVARKMGPLVRMEAFCEGGVFQSGPFAVADGSGGDEVIYSHRAEALVGHAVGCKSKDGHRKGIRIVPVKDN